MIGKIRKSSQQTPESATGTLQSTSAEPKVQKVKGICQESIQQGKQEQTIKITPQKSSKPNMKQLIESKIQQGVQEEVKDLEAKEEKEQLKPQYFIKDKKQYVKPYMYQFKSFAKKRWLQKSLLSVFETEFKLYDTEYYRNAIYNGKITVNGKKVIPGYKIKNNDLIVHKVLREEKPVLAKNIEIVEENQDFLIVNKPPSMPIHPCGGYRYNSLIEILHEKQQKKNLHCVHRLDLQTSGILFLGKNREAANTFTNAIKAGQVSKMYLALVYGEVKEDQFEVDKSMGRMKGPVAKFSVNQDDCKDDWKDAFTRFVVIK